MDRKRIIASLVGLGLLVVAALVGVAYATRGSGDDELVVYTARLHYGEEEVFRRFAEETGYDVKLFGGDGPALNDRLASEGADTDADLLITVDAANLQDAADRGLLAPADSETLETDVPADLRDPEGRWFAITTRARTVMRSTERLTAAEVPTYESLGDPALRGRLCLRTNDSVYNTSLVADLIEKDGAEATERMLRAWMANDPLILGSDVEVLEAIAAGECDAGLTNSYYLGRILAEDPEFPVSPVWVEQEGRGTHVYLSGAGVVEHADNADAAQELLEYLASVEEQGLLAETNSEFPVHPDAGLPEHIADWRGFEVDPIAASADAELQDEAAALMNEVGWR